MSLANVTPCHRALLCATAACAETKMYIDGCHMPVKLASHSSSSTQCMHFCLSPECWGQHRMHMASITAREQHPMHHTGFTAVTNPYFDSCITCSSSDSSQLPVIVGADKMCLVLGVVAQPTLATRQGNTFGTAFRSAADDTEAQTQHDGFDSSIMRVRCTISSCSVACLATHGNC